MDRVRLGIGIGLAVNLICIVRDRDWVSDVFGPFFQIDACAANHTRCPTECLICCSAIRDRDRVSVNLTRIVRKTS